MKINPPLENSTTELPIEFSFVIPSTRHDTRISEGWFEKRVEEEEKWWDNRFGGSTLERVNGQYVEAGHVIEEDVAIITVSMSQEQYQKYRDEIADHIRKRRQNWEQDTVLFKINDHAFIYPNKEYIEGETPEELTI